MNPADKNDGVRSVKMYTTNDLSFAAYLIMHGLEIIDSKKLGSTYKFVFEDNPEIKKLNYQYANSESSRFDDCVRKLKRIIFSSR